MNKREFEDYLDNDRLAPDRYLVEIYLRYNSEKSLRRTVEYLYWSSDGNWWIWESDWYEGEEHVEISAIARVNDLGPGLQEEVWRFL